MKQFYQILIVCLCAMVLTVGFAFGEDKGVFSTFPTKNDGKKWRIGFYEGGPYQDYQQNLVSLIRGFMQLGWMESEDIPYEVGKYNDGIWTWLATKAKSKYLEFPKDAFYSAEWKADVREKMRAEIIERVNSKKDIDLLIAMGTKASQDLANDKHNVPTMVLSTSDPIASGIIKSIEDSGLDHVSARVDPFRYERQIRIFHDIIGFNRLGIAFRDDVSGRSVAAIDKVKIVAEERGFQVVPCHISSGLSTPEEEEEIKKCFHELGEKVDAIYVTLQKGINENSIPDLIKIANQYKIPTFSQSGSHEVEMGFLMSISLASHKYVGEYYAEKIAKVFNGAKPRDLDQLFEDPPKIAINLKTAEIIGFDPPVDALGAADEIYQSIK